MELSKIKDLIKTKNIEFSKFESIQKSNKVNKVVVTDKNIRISKNLLEYLNTEYIVLEFNPTYRVFKFIPTTEISGYKLTKHGSISAKFTLEHFNIKERGIFDAYYDSEDKVVYSVIS